jgi:hypothetical protein
MTGISSRKAFGHCLAPDAEFNAQVLGGSVLISIMSFSIAAFERITIDRFRQIALLSFGRFQGKELANSLSFQPKLSQPSSHFIKLLAKRLNVTLHFIKLLVYVGRVR